MASREWACLCLCHAHDRKFKKIQEWRQIKAFSSCLSAASPLLLVSYVLFQLLYLAAFRMEFAMGTGSAYCHQRSRQPCVEHLSFQTRSVQGEKSCHWLPYRYIYLDACAGRAVWPAEWSGLHCGNEAGPVCDSGLRTSWLSSLLVLCVDATCVLTGQAITHALENPKQLYGQIQLE